MLNNELLYSYNDITIIPAITSGINSRSECDPYLQNNMLPLFTAPMSSVVNEGNFNIFEVNGINSILPRNIDIDTRLRYSKLGKWAAYSLKEFEEYFCNEEEKTDKTWRVLIDIANGHMEKIYHLVEKAKRLHKIEVMIGNIANPQTYYECCQFGIDYVRVGIGAGAGCITSSNTAIHYPMASLIYKCWEIKDRANCKTKIIADGGIRNYSDVIKALALGADYVMIGSLFAQLKESAAVKNNGTVFFYGMASAQGQCDISGGKTKTSEGIAKSLPVIGTVQGWVENMIAYLRSAMSYCNIKYVEDFNPDNVETYLMSNQAKNSINK